MTWASVVWTPSPLRQAAAELISGEVSRLCGVAAHDVRLTRMCPSCGSTGHGRPLILPWEGRAAPPSVSVARSCRLTAIVVVADCAAGIDVEDVESFADDGLSAVLLHDDERAEVPDGLAITWVRKEALLKSAGCGLSVDPRRVRLSGPRQAPVVLEWPHVEWGPRPGWVLDLHLGAGVRAALAGSGQVPDEVMVREVGLGGALGRARPGRAR
jgi:4'-phosphopantetheinyl transferase